MAGQAFTVETIKQPVQLFTLLQSMNRDLSDALAKANKLRADLDLSRRMPTLDLVTAIRGALQSSGQAPLNVAQLSGILGQSQRGFGVVAATLAGLPSPSLFEVGTFGIVVGPPVHLYYVVEGVPRTWGDLSITSTGPANMVTTDTVQNITGGKRFSGTAPVMFGSTNVPQTTVHIQASAVAAFPTLGGADFLLVENNGNAAVVTIPSATGDGIFRVTPSGTTSGGAGTGQLRYNANTNEWFIRINGTDRVIIDATGLFRTYGNQTVVGQGVPSILAVTQPATDRTTALGATTVFAVVTAGLYRLSTYLQVTTAGTSGNIAVNYINTDRVGALTRSNVIDLSSGSGTGADVSINGRHTGSILMYCAAGTNIQVSTTFTVVVGTPHYYLDCTVDRLS